MNNMQMFDEIMGDCCGVDMQTLTGEDVRAQAALFNETGYSVTEDEIVLAIQGLLEYQDTDNEDNNAGTIGELIDRGVSVALHPIR